MIALTLLAAALAGAALWSFAEYAIHNWGGHLAKGRTAFSREHLRHHAERDYFSPPHKKALGALPGATIATVLGVTTMGWLHGLVFASAFVAAYMFYEFLHRRLHTHAPRGRVGRFLRKHHFAHHFNCPKDNHGVTSHVWDVVFGTFEQVDTVRVPEKHIMRWLLDPETGEVRSEFAADYEVRRPRKRRAA